MRVSMDLCGKSVQTPAEIVPKREACNTTGDYCNSLVEEFESTVNHSDSERKRLETELGGVFELIAAAETKLKEAEDVVEKESEHCFCFQPVRGDCLMVRLVNCVALFHTSLREADAVLCTAVRTGERYD
ncbi:hypothetical protein ERJ75_001734000 [Trypanosoma vivax]|nr:hypothetical protein ERJ75_001734000 [Trypanosoma vivax]